MGIHDGHRDRLRENYLEVGLKGKSEHQILELLLTYVVPRKDVNPIAHELMEKFGTLSGVLDADVSELIKFNGITQKGAVLLKLIPDLFPVYFESKYKGKVKLNTSGKIKEYIIPKFANETNEVFYVLCLDNHMNLIRALRHNEGSPNRASLNLPLMVAEVLNTGATQLVLVHNHLSGNVQFSNEDIRATKVIMDAFHNIGIKVHDHLIVSGNNVSTFSDFRMLFEEKQIPSE